MEASPKGGPSKGWWGKRSLSTGGVTGGLEPSL
jgi:hypothetical protein